MIKLQLSITFDHCQLQKMTDIESLRLLTEAVETAGADIAPTYAEYVQLAFAIATDCGEAGREFFHRLVPDFRQVSIRPCRTNVFQCTHETAGSNTSRNGFTSLNRQE